MSIRISTCGNGSMFVSTSHCCHCTSRQDMLLHMWPISSFFSFFVFRLVEPQNGLTSCRGHSASNRFRTREALSLKPRSEMSWLSGLRSCQSKPLSPEHLHYPRVSCPSFLEAFDSLWFCGCWSQRKFTGNCAAAKPRPSCK